VRDPTFRNSFSLVRKIQHAENQRAGNQ